jgi:hypothetical protein
MRIKALKINLLLSKAQIETKNLSFLFHTHTVHLDTIKVFYSPTDAQLNCLKNNIKIYIKKAPTCFGAFTPKSGSALFVLAKVTIVKIVN